MDPKEIKSHLKSAREAIGRKEYKEALKFCKNVLKADKNHYNALVFVGVAAEGLEQGDQALMAYQKAIEVDESQPLAWQGLCGYYEKTEENQRELLPIYEKLLEFRKGDEKKTYETKAKFITVLVNLKETERAIALVQEIINNTASELIQTDIWTTYVQLASSKAVEADDIDMMKKAFSFILSADDLKASEKEDMHKKYICFLCKRNANTRQIVDECQKMAKLYENSALPCEVLCQIHIINSLVNCADQGKLSARTHINRLKEIDADNPFAKFDQALEEVLAKSFKNAKDKLMSGLKQEPGCLAAWLLLSEVHIQQGDATAASKCIEKAKGLLRKADVTLHGFDSGLIKNYLLLLSAEASALQKTPETCENALAICKQILDKNKSHKRALKLMVEMLIQLDQCSEAIKNLEDLEILEQSEKLQLEGAIYMKMKELDKAEQKFAEILKVDESNASALFNMGKLLWKKRENGIENATKSYEYLLKAAKSDPYNAECFLYLGHYQTEVLRDVQKGKKCYQKAFSLDSMNEEIGTALVDAYNATDEPHEAKALLESVTKRASAGTCKWAWLRLGLQQMRSQDASTAIYSLQCALRADKDDYHCWECLGEAYLARGSFTAALKAFTRATELEPNSTYSFYQIGTIKMTLGSYSEAIADYTTILNTSPDYVPALKGIGEGYLQLEKAAVREFFHGRAVSYCESATSFLTRAARKKPELSCLWKLLGDCFCVLHVLPPDDCNVQVPTLLLGSGHDDDKVTMLQKPDLLALAVRCYGMALKTQSECGALWHDLGLAYMRQARIMTTGASGDNVQATLSMNKAFQSLQRALQCEPENHLFWNTLGLIALSKELDSKALAQHSFIKSIQSEQSNPVAWTNLGVLYLRSDDISLAHEAFKVAQSLEPSYVASWIGQALIAETVGQSEEAMDLFRHTTELAHHTEGAIGYAQFVCALLQDQKKMEADWNKYVIEKMHAVPAASDVMAKYTDRVRTNATAYNLYGLLLERQKLYKGAAQAFESAVNLLKSGGDAGKQLRQASLNLARVLVHHEEFEKAVKLFSEFSPETLEEQCSLALALYKMQAYDESITHYEHALKMTDDGGEKSHIYAGMGMVKYASGLSTGEGGKGDVDGAKAILFQCTQSQPPSVHGLLALMSLGLIQEDVALASAVQAELQNYQQNSGAADFAYMLASLHALKGEVAEGKRALSRAIHLSPGESSGWAYLVQYLLSHEREISDTVTNCCRIAMQHDTRSQHKNLGIWLAVAMLGAGRHSRTEANNNSFRAAQKAVILNPEKLESWIGLIGSMYAELMTKRCRGEPEALAQPLLTLITHFMAKVEGLLSQKTGNRTRLQALHLWCVRQYVVALLAAGSTDQAQEFLQQALWLYEEDMHLQNLLAYINQNFSVLKVNVINDSQGFTRLLLVQLYMAHGLVQEAEEILKMWLPQARTKPRKLLAFVRLAFFAFKQLMNGENAAMQTLFNEACSEARKLDRDCVVIHLLMGLLSIMQKKQKPAKKSLQECVKNWGDSHNMTYGKQLAEGLLTQIEDAEKPVETPASKTPATKKKDAKVQRDPFDD